MYDLACIRNYKNNSLSLGVKGVGRYIDQWMNNKFYNIGTWQTSCLCMYIIYTVVLKNGNPREKIIVNN